MIYRTPPEDFNPSFSTVSLFLEHHKKILLMQRQHHKPQGGKWGAPAGKVDDGESILEAMIRELREETKIILPAHKFLYQDEVYVRYDEHDFIYHTFRSFLINMPGVCIDEREHLTYDWFLPKEALRLPLVQDMDSCIRRFYLKQP